MRASYIGPAVPHTPLTRRPRQAPPSRRGTTVVCRSSQSQRGGLRVLEWTGGVLPQGKLVAAVKAAWRQLWLAFMRELAPQSNTGGYSRPTYGFRNDIGTADFPAEGGRYVLYLGANAFSADLPPATCIPSLPSQPPQLTMASPSPQATRALGATGWR